MSNLVNIKKTKRLVAIVCLLMLLIAAAVVVALRERQPLPVPEAQVTQPPAEVRVKAVERKAEPVSEGEEAAASGAVAIVCGADKATADRYEARNDALRSIARRRDLPEKDVAALVKFLASAKDPLPVERIAALKNDVMNRSSAMRVPSAYTKLLHFVEMCISKNVLFVVITHFKNRAFRDCWLDAFGMIVI